MSDNEPNDSYPAESDRSTDQQSDQNIWPEDMPTAPHPAALADTSESEEPIMATLVTTEDGDGIRVGSPFAQDTEIPVAQPVSTPRKPELIYDVGPLKYTAIGSVAAAVMTLAFGAAAAWWFPGGGTLIAGLGCMLSIFGLYSPHKVYASICLAMHLTLFLASYTHAILV